MYNYLGEMAALGTAFCWSFGSIFFTISSRIIGHMAVNRLRLTLALILLLTSHLILSGRLMPADLTGHHLFWFGLSGIIGFTIGDSLLFRSFVLIGPRITMLLMSTAPVFSSIIAWIFLGEILKPLHILAILITLGGISWVILEHKRYNDRKDIIAGILYGLGAGFCQALGLILSKKGLANNFSALDGNIIRIFAATITIWVIPLFHGDVVATLTRIKNKNALLTLSGGAILGPFIGVWLSLFAVQHTYVGIASTLMALPPILLIPLSHWLFKEEITIRAIGGTIIAILGVALIFLVKA